jgi:y4mF family transcriptional regulator
MNNLSHFVKYQRKKQKYTQEELANKAGVGIRFIRELEQGKETLQLDKVNQVLMLFGFGLWPNKQKVDAYNIFWNYFNIAVKITLVNKVIKYGIIIKEIIDKSENEISAWQFVSNNNAIKFQQKPNDALIETILHKDIFEIEEQ